MCPKSKSKVKDSLDTFDRQEEPFFSKSVVTVSNRQRAKCQAFFSGAWISGVLLGI